MLTADEIIKGGRACDIDLIGVFNINPLDECFNRLNTPYRANKITGFEGEIPENRINYHYFYPPAQMGIAIGVNYFYPLKEPIDMFGRGEIASVARGLDYHLILRKKAVSLMDCLNKRVLESGLQKIEYRIFIDTSGLVDRASAYRAGLGFFGKNNCLVNEDYGSYFFIGQILINQKIKFKKTAPKNTACGSCRLCIDACPTGALTDSYQFDPRKCISYLTQKKSLTQEEEKTFTHYLYGCDICQKVCPYNQSLNKTDEVAFQITQDRVYPQLKDIIKMTNAEFRNDFAKTAAGWRGKKNLVRNAKLIMKNRDKMI